MFTQPLECAPNHNTASNFGFVSKENQFGLSFHKTLLFDLVNNSCSFQEAVGKTFICSQIRLLLNSRQSF